MWEQERYKYTICFLLIFAVSIFRSQCERVVAFVFVFLYFASSIPQRFGIALFFFFFFPPPQSRVVEMDFFFVVVPEDIWNTKGTFVWNLLTLRHAMEGFLLLLLRLLRLQLRRTVERCRSTENSSRIFELMSVWLSVCLRLCVCVFFFFFPLFSPPAGRVKEKRIRNFRVLFFLSLLLSGRLWKRLGVVNG